MTLRFASLGSGSRGNALLIEFQSTLLMVDCGLPRREVEARLAAIDRTPRDLTALIVTHEHADHIAGVAPLVRRYGIPLWMTPGTAGASSLRNLPRIRTFNSHGTLTLGDLIVEPYPVPHDAREPCQFVFAGGGRRLGLLTDTGHVTPHIVSRLARCDALALESNHDLDALWNGPYPQSVKVRVASKLGHLDNGEAARLLAQVYHPELQWVAALHISERNNSPGCVRAQLEPLLGGPGQRLHLATQDAPSQWLAVA